MSYSPSGSLWHRWDLHFHTPSSYDYDDKSVTDAEIVDGLLAQGVRVVAITDHHRIDVARIKSLQALGGDRLTVLPGVELRGDHGSRPIHYICIFPEDCDLPHVKETLCGSLKLTEHAIRERGGDDRVYTPIEQGAKAARDLGGIVSIHAGSKTNSIDDIKNTEEFQKRIKYDITKEWVDIMEIGQIRDVGTYLNIIFPNTGLDRPLIICSDNHNIKTYSVKTPLWIKADPTFRGLLMALREPRTRVSLEPVPESLVRLEHNKSRYIKSISFKRRTDTPSATSKWFSGSIEFNPGLVAIVGNKGGGKSALVDVIGLVGGSRMNGAFSFLNPKRFRHPSNGLARQFEARLEWHSGESATRGLDQDPSDGELERLKYLPQDHLETVCNDLTSGSGSSFEQELKTVIFSHVPHAQRLGQTRLDDLLKFRDRERQKRIDVLQTRLKELSRDRATLEARTEPSVRRNIEQQIASKRQELASIIARKPQEVANPALSGTASNHALINEIGAMDRSRLELAERINELNVQSARLEMRDAFADRVLQRIETLRREYEATVSEISADCGAIGIQIREILSLTVDPSPLKRVREQAQQELTELARILNTAEPPGLTQQLEVLKRKIVDTRARLDAPNREYQDYLKNIATWEEQQASLLGTMDRPDSIIRLEAELKALDQIPDRLSRLREEQERASQDIFQEKLGQAETLRTLYKPVQDFVESHSLTRGKLSLEFKAELVQEGFSETFLGFILQNRRGSFMNLDDGRARVADLVDLTRWGEGDSVKAFARSVDEALHFDLRDQQAKHPVDLASQITKSKRVEDLYNYLYGLDFVQARYRLRWDGKDLDLLSPGERGTLLLVFYLLIDKSDLPLLIDQPEGNLDNYTVAKVLVDCIKEARERRQIFIVTHNPNIAVVCDADQVVHARMDKDDGYAVTYTSGSLENPRMSQYVTDVLEGTRWAFDVRSRKYELSPTVATGRSQ